MEIHAVIIDLNCRHQWIHVANNHNTSEMFLQSHAPTIPCFILAFITFVVTICFLATCENNHHEKLGNDIC